MSCHRTQPRLPHAVNACPNAALSSPAQEERKCRWQNTPIEPGWSPFEIDTDWFYAYRYGPRANQQSGRVARFARWIWRTLAKIRPEQARRRTGPEMQTFAPIYARPEREAPWPRL